LICDDASTDSTRTIIDEIANRDSRIIVSHNSQNEKLLKVRNRLLRLAKGELITFQDADDYSHPTRIEKMVDEFQSNKKLGLLASQVFYVDSNERILRKSNKPTNYIDTLKLIYKKNVVGGSIMMITREALNSVGGKFREYFDGLSNQDYDLSFLIVEKFEAYSLNEALYFYRQHDSSNSKLVDIDRILAPEIVKYLANQRKYRKSDDLIDGNFYLVHSFFDKIRLPYKLEPSKIYQEYAENFMYNNLYLKAIETSFEGLKVEPFKLKNWRTLQYCLRVTILKKLGFAS